MNGGSEHLNGCSQWVCVESQIVITNGHRLRLSSNCACAGTAPRGWKAVRVNPKRFGTESKVIYRIEMKTQQEASDSLKSEPALYVESTTRKGILVHIFNS